MSDFFAPQQEPIRTTTTQRTSQHNDNDTKRWNMEVPDIPIGKLPCNTTKDLCLVFDPVSWLLDWQAIITTLPKEFTYTTDQVRHLMELAERKKRSPTALLLHDLHNRGFTSKGLRAVFEEMGHAQALEILDLGVQKGHWLLKKSQEDLKEVGKSPIQVSHDQEETETLEARQESETPEGTGTEVLLSPNLVLWNTLKPLMSCLRLYWAGEEY